MRTLALLLEISDDDLQSLKFRIKLSDVELVLLKMLLCTLELAGNGVVVGLPVVCFSLGLFDLALRVPL